MFVLNIIQEPNNVGVFCQSAILVLPYLYCHTWAFAKGSLCPSLLNTISNTVQYRGALQSQCVSLCVLVLACITCVCLYSFVSLCVLVLPCITCVCLYSFCPCVFLYYLVSPECACILCVPVCACITPRRWQPLPKVTASGRSIENGIKVHSSEDRG